MSSQLEQIRSLLIQGEGIIFLGPDIFLPSMNYAQGVVLDEIRDSLTDSTGWEHCDEDKQLALSLTDLGYQGLAQNMSKSFPYLEVQSDGGELGKCFGNFRPKYVVDLNFHNAFESLAIRKSFLSRRITSDEDLSRHIGGKVPASLYKLRGDLWLDNACMTVDHLEQKMVENPKMVREILSICMGQPVFMIGFKPQESLFRWIRNTFLSDSELIVACFVSSNRNWKKWCQSLGLSILSAPTKTELTQKLSVFFDANTLMDSDATITIKTAMAKDGLKRTRTIDNLEWLELARAGTRDDVKAARTKILPIAREWVRLSESGFVVDPQPVCDAIAFQTRSGFNVDAEHLLESALTMVQAWPLDKSKAQASLGRSMMRLGDEWRGYVILRQALLSGALDQREQADSLAWVSKAVLTRIEDLMVRAHVRAATEQIAQFLNTFAQLLSLSAEEADDEESKWSLYYINLRLGRIMMLASSMAGQSNHVYAQQSVSLLLRTIELVPEKPDGYKYLRPMLTDSNSPMKDMKKWESILDNAPPTIQKKLSKTNTAEEE